MLSQLVKPQTQEVSRGHWAMETPVGVVTADLLRKTANVDVWLQVEGRGHLCDIPQVPPT